MNKYLSSGEKGQRIESNICTCSHERTNNFNSKTYKYSKKVNATNQIEVIHMIIESEEELIK